MKKIVLGMLVLMLAAPAMAIDVTFTAVQEGTTGVVRIYYDAPSPPLPRAFALDITVDNDQNLVAISNLSADYWVYPGSIDINDAGEVNDVGTAVADPCDLPSDTQPGLPFPTVGITLEMGSLYVGAPNAPDPCDLLCKVEVSDDCNLTITGNVGRGKAVLEGAAQAMTNLPITLMVSPVTPPGYTISGQVASRAAVGEDGVTMTGLPGAPVTSGGGYYTDTVSSGWSGTVTPTKTGKGFVAASITYSNVMANQASQDYLVGDGSCLRSDICSTAYTDPDGYITYEDRVWFSTYYPIQPATVKDCLGDPSCLRADICSTAYGAPDGLITYEDRVWFSTYYPIQPATVNDCCP